MEKTRKVELYHSAKEGRYYFIGLVICPSCDKIVERVVMLITNAKNNNTVYCCLSCFIKSEVRGDYLSIKKALLVDTLPKDAKPVLNLGFDIQTIRESTQSVFQAVRQSEHGERVLDKTFQCHNPDFMIQSDAKNPSQLGDDGALRIAVEDQRIEVNEKAKLTKEQRIAVKRLESAIINKERNVSEGELDKLLDSYKNAEPALAGPEDVRRLE